MVCSSDSSDNNSPVKTRKIYDITIIPATGMTIVKIEMALIMTQML
jgi:hypothetical protein